jgi:hypothetical protein
VYVHTSEDVREPTGGLRKDERVCHGPCKKVFVWGRCYDHNFLRFSTIFGEKIGVFLKNHCNDQLLKFF